MKGPVALPILALACLATVPSQDVFDALRKGDIPMVKALLEKAPQVLESRDSNGMTPLHHAAMGQAADLINYLLDKGARLELQDAQHKTPLHLAAMNDRAAVVAELLKRDALLEARDDYLRTALILCARERGQAATGRVLIKAGADVNAVDKFGDDALSLAAWRGEVEFVDLLLEKGARVPEGGPKWHGMIFQAASQGLTSLFRRLTAKGVDKSDIHFPLLEGDYLGRKPPAGKAELFGLGIISSIWGIHSTAVFSPDGNEVYWAPMESISSS
jgi:ankyrin repeat protein